MSRCENRSAESGRGAAKCSRLRSGCIAILGLAACGERSIASTGEDGSASEAETSEATDTSGTPAPPDLGASAVQCGRPGESATSDAEIAALEGCEIYAGAIAILDVTDLSPLSSLRIIRGEFACAGSNFYLDTLEGLEQLEWAGSFYVTNNDLNDLSAVGRLQGVDDYLGINGLPNLTELNGLEQLRTVGGRVSIVGNGELTNLEGLSGLEWIGGELSIMSNDKLTSLDGLSALQQVDGDVSIRVNPQLAPADIEAFLNRIEIGGEVHLD